MLSSCNIWKVSSVGRASDAQARGHEFESRKGKFSFGFIRPDGYTVETQKSNISENIWVDVKLRNHTISIPQST